MTKASGTRLSILQKAFELIYTKGYQNTSIDDIIATTHLTKGAFYYHFKTKNEMGLAIINEVLRPTMLASFILPLENSTEPLKAIYSMMKNLLLEQPDLQLAHGCPAGNLTHEMTSWSLDFKEALSVLIKQWEFAIKNAINKAKKTGTVKKDINAEQVAFFLISGYWGIRNFGKLYTDDSCYRMYLKELKIYLNNLG